MTIRRYTDRHGRTTHTIDLRIPRAAWTILRALGAHRDPQEIMADQVRAFTGGPAIDYWSETEAPTT